MRVGGQLHALAALPPGKRPGTNCIGGWVGPRASLDGCGKSRPHRDSIPGPSSPQRVAIPTTLSRPTLLWGSPKNDVKCGNHCSYGHLARTVQKVCKIPKNTKFRNLKPGYRCVCVCVCDVNCHCELQCSVKLFKLKYYEISGKFRILCDKKITL
jgi:hypothetical protein